MWKFRFFSTSSRLICIAPSGFSKGDHPATRWENSNIEQYFTFTSKLVGKSVYISLKDNNSYKLILNHLHTKGSCQKRFSGIRPLRGSPPPPLTENQSEKKKVFFLSGKGGYPPPP